MLGMEQARRLDAVEAGHPDVQEHQIGPGARGELQRPAPGRRLRDRFEPRRDLDQRPRGLQEDRLVVDGHDPHMGRGLVAALRAV